MTTPLTPLLAASSPLDARMRELVAGLFRGEQHLMANLPTDDPRDPKRLRRVLLTRGEMFGQPGSIRTTLAQGAGAIAATARALAARKISRVVLTGCGDSLAVMIGARMLLERMFGVPCEPVQALDLAYYFYPALGPETLVMGLSSSGATPRTVEAMLMAKAQGAITLALSNTPGSALAGECDYALPVLAERRGWPTQSSTAAMALLCRLGAETGALGGQAGAAELLAGLDTLPATMADILAALDAPMAHLAATQADRRLYLYAGGGPAYAAAVFGATKMKECSPDHAICIPIEEYHHYNSQKPDDPLLLLAPAGPTIARARDTAEEGRRWRGRVFSFVNGAETALDGCSDAVFRLPEVTEALTAFTFTLPLQLFAYHAALEKFRRAGVET